ncbi:MAG: COG4315 family predicted lipoprotein [Nocardioides sp.]
MHKSVVLSPLLLLTLAACGGSGGTGYGAAGTPSPGAASAPSGGGAVVRVASTSLGKVLVDAQGHTLYMLTADSPGHSTCNTQCLAYWPAVAPPASGGAAAPGVSATLASTAVAGGGHTVTAGGRPLYTFITDTKPGDVTGEGVATFGGVWYAVSPAGQPVKSAPSSGGSTSGGGGY